MGFPINKDTVNMPSMELPIVLFSGVTGGLFLNYDKVLSPMVVLILANSADPEEM